jgi:hypothetical protein
MGWEKFAPIFEYRLSFNDYNWPWRGHSLFAYHYIRNIAPKNVVELGTHKGSSLFSFAQAAKDAQLPVKISAIDSWEGDEQAGFYDEVVFDEVNAIKQQYYSAVDIRLMKMYFDNALEHFDEKSIDFLHIDGLHTYEAVMHDFEQWFPKLANEFTVLFHDTQVKEFGVKDVFKKIKEQYPDCFYLEFEHSYGLGLMSTVKNFTSLFSDPLQQQLMVREFESRSLQEIFDAFQTALQPMLQQQQVLAREIDELKQQSGELQQDQSQLQHLIGALNEHHIKNTAKQGQLLAAKKTLSEQLDQRNTAFRESDRKRYHLQQLLQHKDEHLNWFYKNYDRRPIYKLLGDRILKRKTRAADRPGISDNLPLSKLNGHLPVVNQSLKLLRLAVFVHLYYTDLWPEIKAHLLQMGLNFDLYVSLCEEQSEASYYKEKITNTFPGATVMVFPNKGLDVGPFVELMQLALSKEKTYDYFLKIHTKKSLGVDAAVGEAWRKKTYDSLMGNLQNVAGILQRFESTPGIGMIGPTNSLMSTSVNDLANQTNVNQQHFSKYAQQLGVQDNTLSFFGGTMFWARWQPFINPFSKRQLSIEDFEYGYRHDGLIAHAFERLFASMVRDAEQSLYELKQHDVVVSPAKQKILWLHPGFGIGGGNRVIFEIAAEQSKYYEVTSCSMMGNGFTNWMQVAHALISFSNEKEAYDFLLQEKFDYVFATGWQTVKLAKLLPYGRKYYFIQDYEPWFNTATETEAAATYQHQLPYAIVIANWLQQKLLTDHQYKTTVVHLGTRLLPNASVVHHELPIKILLYFKYRSHIGRGADLMLAAMALLAKEPKIELHVFGHEDPKVEGIYFHGELVKEKLYALYGSCHFFIDLSRHRGYPTIAVELSQFGCISLFTNPSIGVIEYGFEHGVNALFIEAPQDILKTIQPYLDDVEAFKKMQQNLISLSKTFQWRTTANDINQLLQLPAN